METSSSYRRQAISKNPYMFNGGVEYNEDTEWYETAFRQYDPAIGRFGGIDPMAHQIDGINPYQFAYNDPISLNDPTGLMPNGGGGQETLEESQSFSSFRGTGFGNFLGSRNPNNLNWMHQFDDYWTSSLGRFEWDDLTKLWNSVSDDGLGTKSTGSGVEVFTSLDDYVSNTNDQVWCTYCGNEVGIDGNGNILYEGAAIPALFDNGRGFEQIGGKVDLSNSNSKELFNNIMLAFGESLNNNRSDRNDDLFDFSNVKVDVGYDHWKKTFDFKLANGKRVIVDATIIDPLSNPKSDSKISSFAIYNAKGIKNPSKWPGRINGKEIFYPFTLRILNSRGETQAQFKFHRSNGAEFVSFRNTLINGGPKYKLK